MSGKAPGLEGGRGGQGVREGRERKERKRERGGRREERERYIAEDECLLAFGSILRDSSTIPHSLTLFVR